MAADSKRIEIGFDGGQVLAVRVSPAALKELRGALGGEGWLHLVIDEAELDISLTKIVFIRTAADEQRVGFGSA